MSMPSSPGWYDDPEDAALLRYFDGVVWTRHTAPKSTRPATTAEQAARAGAEAARQWNAPGHGAHPRTPGGTARPPAGAPGGVPGGQGGVPGAQPGPPNPQFPGAPQQHQWNAPPMQYGQPVGPTTPDGQPLASYGQRVGAFALDFLATGLIGGILSLPIQLRVSSELQGAADRLGSGSGSFNDLLDAAMRATNANVVPLTLIALLSSFAYHVLFVGLLSATPGKLALGLSIRRPEAPGRVGWAVAVRRRLLQTALGLFRFSPALELLYFLGSAVDLAWPLRDPRRQALHDKVAGTVVVRGRQPRAGRPGQ